MYTQQITHNYLRVEQANFVDFVSTEIFNQKIEWISRLASRYTQS